MRNLVRTRCCHIGFTILVFILKAIAVEQDNQSYDRFSSKAASQPSPIDGNQPSYQGAYESVKQNEDGQDDKDEQNQLSSYVVLNPDGSKDWYIQRDSLEENRMPTFKVINNSKNTGTRYSNNSFISLQENLKEAEEKNQLEKLQNEIKETTSKINLLYTSKKKEKDLKFRRRKLKDILEHKNKTELIRELENSYNSIKRLKDQLKTDKEVQVQMIRRLARAKLKDMIKTRTLQSLLSYYKPSHNTLPFIALTESQQRAIIDAKINMLPEKRRMEFEKRVHSLKNSDNRRSHTATKR